MNIYTNEEYKILEKMFNENENKDDFFYFMVKSYVGDAMRAINSNEDPTTSFLSALPNKTFNAMYHDPIEELPLLLNDTSTTFLKTIVTWRICIGK